ncbi:polysaccharide deacetylase [Salinisphaera hydrothermalis C41B8]|uniref:Polysaccharide deacetylase n=2 Tax=Salinisphaera TaxID=180541 RepID=A0A084IMC4_SALHC|nr:XrtA system polysaccharide deacetylase [Salinisphaera hydrothermalis]KEZ77858.1 polysaccharide deacetylase [Salinisphaera hydrothermalis C41B8]
MTALDWHPQSMPKPTCINANAMTVDVEEYFQVSAFEQHIGFEQWARMPSRVEASTDRILAMFELANVRATFFTLGWVAERHPGLIRRIVDAGHELASHGQNHVRVINQDRKTFGADIRKAKAVLEETGGQAVRGYRAASFSIGATNLWALDELAEAGYDYSSSIYPGTHDAYGMPEAPRFPFRPRPGGLLEIPVTTVDVGGRRLPCAGGGFFRLYPYRATRAALRRVNRRDGQPTIFYFHPWEIDPEQPRVPGLDAKRRFRHYLNIDRVEPRLRRLLTDFRWDRMDRVFPVNAESDWPTASPA